MSTELQWRDKITDADVAAHVSRGGLWVTTDQFCKYIWLKNGKFQWLSDPTQGSLDDDSLSELDGLGRLHISGRRFAPVDLTLKPLAWPTTSAPAPAPPIDDWRGCPSADEITAHEARGGRWKATGHASILAIWTTPDGPRGWWSETGTPPRADDGWPLDCLSSHLKFQHLKFQPVDADLKPMPWPTVKSTVKSTATVTVTASEQDAYRRAIAEAVARPSTEKWTPSGYVIGRAFQKSIEFKKETTMPPVAASTLTVTVTAPRTLVDDLIEDGVEVAYREAGREATKLAHDLLVDALSLELSERDRDLGRDVLKQVLASEAGVALVGAVASFGLPEVARLVGRGADPRVIRLARECRREGVRPAAQRLISKFKELAGGAMGKLMGLISGLPATGSAREGDDVAAGPQPALAAAGGLFDAQVMASTAERVKQ